MKKMRIGVLYGGKSGEHEVSLRSAASVVANLDRDRYEIVPIGIDLTGIWHLQEEARVISRPDQGESLELAQTGRTVAVLPGVGLAQGSHSLEVDVVFPVLHGSFGEDGTVQGLLETAGIPYIGAGVLGSALSMDKEKTKQLWRSAGLPVVDWITLRENTPETRRKAGEAFGYPCFVKPAVAGSSVGIHKVDGREGLEAALADAFRYSHKVLIEPAVTARELECAVLGNRAPVAFPPGEIIPRGHAFYDYDAKYLDPDGAMLVIPADVPKAVAEELQGIAVRAFLELEVSGLSRVDFFLEAGTGKLFLNEINTLPGFTNISMYPKLCQAAGIGYAELLDRLIGLALENHERARSLRYRYYD